MSVKAIVASFFVLTTISGCGGGSHAGSLARPHSSSALTSTKPAPASTTAVRVVKPSPPAETPNPPCPPEVGTGQIGPFDEGPFGESQYFTTTTSFMGSDGWPYQVYAGADGDNDKQGEIRIWRMDKDPCDKGNYDGIQTLIRVAHPSGTDTLIAVHGDRVTVRSAAGAIQTIDVIEQGPDATAGR
jgi:hypothetical protein